MLVSPMSRKCIRISHATCVEYPRKLIITFADPNTKRKLWQNQKESVTRLFKHVIQLFEDAQILSSFLYQIGSEKEIPKYNRTVIISCTCINNFILHNHTIS